MFFSNPVLEYGAGLTRLGGGPTHLINIKEDMVLIVNDDLISEAKMFIWLNPLLQSVDDTTTVLRAATSFANLGEGLVLIPSCCTPSMYSCKPLLASSASI